MAEALSVSGTLVPFPKSQSPLTRLVNCTPVKGAHPLFLLTNICADTKRDFVTKIRIKGKIYDFKIKLV